MREAEFMKGKELFIVYLSFYFNAVALKSDVHKLDDLLNINLN